MKKLLTALLVLGGLVLTTSAQASTGGSDAPLRSSNDTITYEIQGTTDVGMGVNDQGRFYSTVGIYNQEDVFLSPQAASSDALKNAGFTATTGSVINGGAATFLQSDISSQTATVPRNITIYSSCTIGAATTTLTGYATFYGIDNLGNFVSEMIKFTTGPVLQSTGVIVAPFLGSTTTPQNFGQGRVAFAVVSSITVQITSMTESFGQTQVSPVKFMIGWGNRLGLSNNITEVSDIYKIVEGPINVAVAPNLVDPIYDTYIPSSVPDGNRSYRVRYRVKSSPYKPPVKRPTQQ